MKLAIYPGTFDPVTTGHLDIIYRASKMFDKLTIAVAKSESKQPMFSLEHRIEMLKAVIEDLNNTDVIGFDGLLVDLSNKLNSNIVIRGLRAVSDFEYELQMGYANSSLKKELETIYLMPSLEHAFVSSSVVRTILEHNGKVDHIVPPKALAFIKPRKQT